MQAPERSSPSHAPLALVILLGGFTLAVEVVAVHLGECAGRVTFAAFLERLKAELERSDLVLLLVGPDLIYGSRGRSHLGSDGPKLTCRPFWNTATWRNGVRKSSLSKIQTCGSSRMAAWRLACVRG